MKAFAPFISSITIIVLTSMVGIPAGSSGASTPVEPGSVEVHDASPALQAQLDDALGRFATAGLILPELEVTFHDSRDGCNGHPGYFHSQDGVGVVDICNPNDHLILHELAHAWVHAHVSDDTRNDVVEYWSSDSWNDRSTAWTARGTEKAADAIAFALGDRSDNPAPRQVQFLCSYSLLTGRELPGPSVECDAAH